jgi:hypothetical protein
MTTVGEWLLILFITMLVVLLILVTYQLQKERERHDAAQHDHLYDLGRTWEAGRREGLRDAERAPEDAAKNPYPTGPESER